MVYMEEPLVIKDGWDIHYEWSFAWEDFLKLADIALPRLIIGGSL